MKRVSVFGSTGSVGTSTLDLLERKGGADAITVAVLTGGQNIALLARQARQFNAEFAVTADEKLGPELARLLDGCDTKALAGRDALIDAASEPVDWAMSAIVGAAGLEPTMAMAQRADVLALANKESLVCAGELLKETCAGHGTKLLPADSEHSAIYQCLLGQDDRSLSRIFLTASGGPFRTKSLAEMEKATVREALNHPNWDMGQRITIDSASMFNKALEVIEAKHLFDVQPHQVEVVVHPQSVVHSMVEFADGAVIAQLGAPDMRGPIGFALHYPDRLELPVERLDFATRSRLDFEPPDEVRFPALRLAREAMRVGGGMGAVLNAAKEIALDGFLGGHLRFTQMAECVEATMEVFATRAKKLSASDGLGEVLLLDADARAHAQKIVVEWAGHKQKVV